MEITNYFITTVDDKIGLYLYHPNMKELYIAKLFSMMNDPDMTYVQLCEYCFNHDIYLMVVADKEEYKKKPNLWSYYIKAQKLERIAKRTCVKPFSGEITEGLLKSLVKEGFMDINKYI